MKMELQRLRRKMATRGCSWSGLPPELLTSIGKRLATRIDVLRFRSVCSSWRSSIPFGTWRPSLPLTLPFPIVPNRYYHPPCHYTVTEATVYRLQPLHNPSGSPPQACVIKVSESRLSQGKMQLLNPLSLDIITPLPQSFPKILDLSQFRISEICRSWWVGIMYVCNHPDELDFNEFNMAQDEVNTVEKAVLLTDRRSDSNDLIVVVIYNKGDVGVLRLGDERWKPLVEYQGKSYRDLINFKGKIYAVNPWGDCLVNDSSLNISEFSAPWKFPMGDKKYLVESCGELWLLDREWRTQSDNVWYYPEANIVLTKLAWYDMVIWFNVYKLDEEEHKWGEVPDLGNRILFADRDCSFSVSAADFAGGNCKGNCIFFLNSCSISDKNYHDDCDALRGLGSKEPEIYLVGDHCVDQLVAYPGYADLFWPLPSWLATVSSSSSQS